jgi:hypothetical protein
MRAYDKKTTVENCFILDVTALKQAGILRPNVHHLGSWVWSAKTSVAYELNTTDTASAWLRLAYNTPHGEFDYDVRLLTTSPHLGGVRWWFECPLVIDGQECNRRVGRLYLKPRGRYFGCRCCHDLTYRACQEGSRYARLHRQLAEYAPHVIPDDWHWFWTEIGHEARRIHTGYPGEEHFVVG